MPNGVPTGFHSLTPSLTVNNGHEAIDFYKRAFGAELVFLMAAPGGGPVGHAELKIGDSHFYLNDEFPQSCTKSPKTLGGTVGGLQIYVSDADALYNQALAAGAQTNMPPTDMFWGDRMSQVTDPYGHVWNISTRKEELTHEEMHKRAEAFWKQMAASQGK